MWAVSALKKESFGGFKSIVSRCIIKLYYHRPPPSNMHDTHSLELSGVLKSSYCSNFMVAAWCAISFDLRGCDVMRYVMWCGQCKRTPCWGSYTRPTTWGPLTVFVYIVGLDSIMKLWNTFSMLLAISTRHQCAYDVYTVYMFILYICVCQ